MWEEITGKNHEGNVLYNTNSAYFATILKQSESELPRSVCANNQELCDSGEDQMNELLKARESAVHLRISLSTFERICSRQDFPRPIRFSKRGQRFYKQSDLDKWRDKQIG